MTGRHDLTAMAEALEIAPDEAELLRQQWRADPPRGCPLTVRDEAGDELGGIDPGKWQDAGFTDANGILPRNCPVTPLGMDDRHCYFLSTLGHIRVLTENVGKSAIMMLFAGRTRYLEWAWPRYGKADKHGHAPVTGWAAEDAIPALIDACAMLGTFTDEDQVRGRGAWLNADGSLIYHAGDQVYFDGRWRSPGFHGGHVYPGRPRIGRPAKRFEEAGPGSAGDRMFEMLRTFNWDRGELDARLCFGWAMTAKVGGALARRPVALVTGQEGSGKTTLQELLRLFMNGALMRTSNTTQAGIYQKVRQDSVAILADELGDKDDMRATQKILELVRVCYSGDKMQRGGKDGTGSEFNLMSSFMGSSIARPATTAQDDSRMVSMMLRPLPTSEGVTAAEIEARTLERWAKDVGGDSPIKPAEVEAWGRQMLRRWFEWWPRWPALLRVFRHALKAAGHDDRAADTFGPLAAAYHLALHDDMPDVGQIKEWLDYLRPEHLTETAHKEETWRRCLMYPLEVQPEILKNHAGRIRSMADVLVNFRRDPVKWVQDLEEVAPWCGLAVSWPKGAAKDWENLRLFFPVKHPALSRLYEESQWRAQPGADGPWIGILRQMPREWWFDGSCGKGLDKKRAGLHVRLALVLDAGEDGSEDEGQ